MKNKLTFITLVLLAINALATSVPDALGKYNVSYKDNAIIIGVNKTDCDLHLTELNKVFRYLSYKNCPNVVFVTKGLTDEENGLFFSRFKDYKQGSKIINDDALYSSIAREDLSSFCAIVSKKKVVHIGSIGYFFSNLGEVEEQVEIWRSNIVELKHPTIPNFMPSSYFFNSQYLVGYDRTYSTIAVFDKTSGQTISSVSINDLDIPREQIRQTLLNEPQLKTTLALEERGEYGEVGLPNYKVNNIFNCVDVVGTIGLVMEHYYFDGSLDDYSIEHKEFVVLLDSKLQFIEFYRIENSENEKNKHFVRSLYNTSVMYKEAFISSNAFLGDDMRNFMPVSRFTGKNNILEIQNNFDHYIPNSLRNKYNKNYSLISIRYASNSLVAFYNYFPVTYRITGSNLSVINLENNTFKKDGKYKATGTSFYIYDVSTNKFGYTVAYMKDQTVKQIACYNENGGLLKSVPLEEVKVKSSSVHTHTSLFTLVATENKKAGIVEYSVSSF